MPGKYQYDVEIKSNVTKLLTDMKEVQQRKKFRIISLLQAWITADLLASIALQLLIKRI